MACSSAGSSQTPPSSTPPPPIPPPTPPPPIPPPPMTSQEGNTKPCGQAASGRERRRDRRNVNIKVFDTVYQRAKVHVFPDFVESKVTLYKKVIPARPPNPAEKVGGPQTSSKQTTESTANENSAEQTSKGTNDSQQQGGRTEATGSRDNLVGSLQDKKVGEESQSFSAKGEIKTSSDGKDKDGSKTKPKKVRRKDLSSYVLDEEKLKNPKILKHLESDDCELLVVERIKAALEEIAEPDDPPVFLLHNQNLSSKAASSKSGEKDVLVLHPHLGVLLLEVKAVKNKDAFSRFDEATAQLLHAKESVQREMRDLLEKDAVILAIALPNLQPKDSSDIRQKAQERLSTASEVTAATSTGSNKKNRAERKSDPKIKDGALLGNHPEILFVCGSTAEVFTELVTRLKHLRATASHAFKGSTVKERLVSFKTACIRRLSVAGLHPGQSVRDNAALHRRFLLTEEQLGVRDSQAELLHISGPPGSGKTLLLAERARRWLREGCRLALTVGDVFSFPTCVVLSFNVLLRHLTDSVCGEKTDVARVSIHKDRFDLLQWLDTVSTADPVSVIVDEATFSLDPSSYARLLDHVTAGRVCGLWTAYTSPLSDRDKTKLQSLGGSITQLSVCLRCPPHVMSFTNSVKGEHDPPLLPPPFPVTRELGVEVKVISHSDHRPSQFWNTCPTCTEEGTTLFSSLGLLGQHATSALSLSDVIVITIGDFCISEVVAAWLRDLGLHAVAETQIQRVVKPVLPPGVTPSSDDEAETEAIRQRILKGKDVRDRPVVHVVRWEDFLGLERPVVLLWHWDFQDESRDWQTQEKREARMSRHRGLWFRAASRCQGRLVVMAVTPSPLLSLLPATSPPTPTTLPATAAVLDTSSTT